MNFHVRKGAMVLAAGIVLLVGGVTAPSASASAMDSGPFTWVNANSGKCLEIWSYSTANGADANQWDCYGGSTQKWYSSNLNGWGTLRNANSGKCLEIRGDSTANGAAANQWDCNGSATQQWNWTPSGTLMNGNSGKCLEIRGDSTANGARANQWDCNGSATQRWR
ncbi:RICIN domain-containing protein [Streptomyces sp. 147326]|uniref:RICIN domain-containing protein n=1 Tax=Streptomyces sp. 147326 TaxID=3074379 RepID=UPI003857CB21